MNQEEYFNIVTNEIKKAEEFRKNNEDTVNFYIDIEGSNSIKIQEALRNISLADERIKSFKEIELLPIYERILKMTPSEIEVYKTKRIEEKQKTINQIETEIKEINDNIKERSIVLEEHFNKYKQQPNIKEVYEGQEIKSYINQCLKEIERKEERIKNIKNDISIISNLPNITIRNNRIYELGLLYLHNELKKHKVSYVDRIVFPLYNNKEIIWSIIEKITKYNHTTYNNISKEIDVPKILNEYDFDGYETPASEWLSETDSSICCNDNKIQINEMEDFDVLLNNLEYGKDMIIKSKEILVEYKKQFKKFTEIFNKKIGQIVYSLSELYHLIYIKGNLEICSSIEKLEPLCEEYNKLNNKKIKTKKNESKKEMLEALIEKRVKEVLNKIWNNLCKNIVEFTINIKYNTTFCNNAEKIKDYSKIDSMIININNYNDLNLIFMETHIEQLLKKYEDMVISMEALKENIIKSKKEMKKETEEKEEKLNNIREEINKLYRSINPEIKDINVEYYKEILDILTKDTELTKSKVRVEREALINKVCLESANQVQYNINDFEKFKEEVKKITSNSKSKVLRKESI